MLSGYHHLIRKNKTSLNKSTAVIIIERMVYFTAFIGALGNIPQLMKVWFDRNTAGVSFITWLGFLAGSLFWLLYGILHKEKPIIIANLLFALIQLLIVMGLVINHNVV
jgi:MtN3 and saliva related transmembrane protein